jgi:hypothetical protein
LGRSYFIFYNQILGCFLIFKAPFSVRLLLQFDQPVKTRLQGPTKPFRASGISERDRRGLLSTIPPLLDITKNSQAATGDRKDLSVRNLRPLDRVLPAAESMGFTEY